VPTRFERDTAVVRRDDRTFDARVDRGWWVMRGPNGGYLAAIVLRALTEAVDDPLRSPRSLTMHFTAPPKEGEITITTALERTGRSLTSCTARVHQGVQLVALAVAAFATAREGPEFCDLTPPSAPPPDTIARMPTPAEAPPIAHRWETRWVIGRPPAPDAPLLPEAVGGGWLRLEEPQLLDAEAVTAITDAWIPPAFSRTNEQLTVPTVDLTVHFRTTVPLPDSRPEDFVFATFRTNAAADGFLEEDGEVWSADGRLIAQSRQLAVALPFVTP